MTRDIFQPDPAPTDAFLGKVPPHSTEAELSVIGGILLHGEKLDDVADMLKPTDFYTEAHETIFQAMLDLGADRRPVDLIQLSDILETRGELERVGGREYLASILDRVPTGADIQAHARIVADRASVRACIGAALDILQRGYGDYGDAQGFVADSQAALLEVGTGEDTEAVPLKGVLMDTVRWLGGLVENGAKMFGVPTGLRRVDGFLGGLQPGGYYIIAGATSHGKSALAAQIARNAGVPVYFASIEMSRRQLALRLISQETGISVHRLLHPDYWGKEGTGQIYDAARDLSKIQIYIDDRGALTPAMVAANTRRLLRKNDIGLGIVDYVQIGKPSKEKRQSRERDVADMSAEYKALAKSAGIPFIALSQLNRQGQKSGERPTLMSLRDSGSLEQDADAVLFVWRPEKGEHESDAREPAQIIVAKNRITGPIGTAMVDFLPTRTLFVDREPKPGEPEEKEWWQ